LPEHHGELRGIRGYVFRFGEFFFRRDLADRCDKLGYELYLPEKALCGDNAAMIASQGYYEFMAGNIAGLDLNASAAMGIDR
jgi:N6-L-threonylcarbamoyladenine synthase